jgi:hypothetical protein
MQDFADQMAALEAAIRRERCPLAVPDFDRNYRPAAASVLRAEIKHAIDDFWRSVHAQGAGLLFDHYQREREARPFRFDHEVRAREAYAWLSDLNMHEADKDGPWATWMHFSEAQREAWRARWFFLARGFLRRMKAYQAAKAACHACGCRAAAATSSARRSTSTSGWKGLSSLGRSRMSIGR